MQRALVIKSYGDPQIAGAIVDGVVKTLPKGQMQIVKAEIDRQRIVRKLVRVAVGNTKTDEDYACMTVKAMGNYGYIPAHGRLYGAVMGAWGLLWTVVHECYNYLSEINREG